MKGPDERDCPMPSRPRPAQAGPGGGPASGPDEGDASSGNAAALDLIFAALADPTRRAILSMLLEDDMAVSDVAAGFSISLAAISRHLGVLAGAGLIRQERRGRITWCQLEPEAMRAAMIWMRGFGQFDPIDLDAFERFLDSEGLALFPPPPTGNQR